jgi:hypothetical protein
MALTTRTAALLALLGAAGCSSNAPKEPPAADAPRVALSPVSWATPAMTPADDSSGIIRALLGKLGQGDALFASIRDAVQAATSSARVDAKAARSLTGAGQNGDAYWVRLEFSTIDASKPPEAQSAWFWGTTLWFCMGPFSYWFNDVAIDNLRVTAEVRLCQPDAKTPLATIVVDSADCETDFIDRHDYKAAPIATSIVMPPWVVWRAIDVEPGRSADVVVSKMVESVAEKVAETIERAERSAGD